MKNESGSNRPTLQGKVVITGASGFIGGQLRDRLLELGCDVVCVRRKGSPASKKGRSVELAYTDIAGFQDFFAEEKPDYVFHVAGATKGVSYQDFRDANVVPTQNLLQAIAESKIALKRFVLFSSLAAFGPSLPTKPLSEKSIASPIEFYGKSKLEAEEIASRFFAQVPITILRPGGVYGPGDVDYFKLFEEAKARRNVFFGNRNRWFSAIYVDDMVDASLLAAASPKTAGKGYFVCDQRPITWETFQDAIVRSQGKRVLTLNLPESIVTLAAYGGEALTRFDKKPRLFNRQKAIMGAQEAWTCDSRKLSEDAGYKPQVDLELGVKRAWDWYKKNNWL